MQPFWLYSEVAPVLGRSDLFVTVTKYEAEPDPYRDLLHFPGDPSRVPMLGRTLHQLTLRSGIIPPLVNVGIHEERHFFAFSLGLLRNAPAILPLQAPVAERFWSALAEGLADLHRRGYSYGHLREDTVAITDRGAPLLFETTAIRSLRAQPPEVDIAALQALRARVG
jgi:hypothetical protein